MPRTVSFDWGTMDWLIEDSSHESPGFSLARMVVHAGQRSEHHLHKTCHEAITVTDGKCVLSIGQDTVQLQAPQTVFIPKGTSHAVDNTAGDTDVILLTTYSSGSRDYQPIS